MKNLIILIFGLIMSTMLIAQVPLASEYPVTKNVNWRFMNGDTVTFNQITIQDKGRWLPNGNIDYIYGVGPYTWPTTITGTKTQYLKINPATKVMTWARPSKLDLYNFEPGQMVFGGDDSTATQDYNFIYDSLNNYLTLGNINDITGTTPGRITVSNGIDASSLYADQIYVGNFALGEMWIDGGALHFMDLGGDLFSIGRMPWSTDMNILFPAAKGTANQSLKVGAVAGDDVQLIWETFLTTEVDGLITNEGSLTVASGSASTSEISSNTSGSTNVVITAAGINSISEAGNNITITATEVDGSTSNELQDLSYNSGTHAVDITSGTDAVIPLADNSTTGLLTSTDHTTFAKSNGFTMIVIGAQGTINDGQTYYSGATTQGTGTTADINRMYIPVDCTLKSVYGFCINTTPSSGSETSTVYIRKNNTTDITVSSTVVHNASQTTFNGTGLSATFVAGDYIEAKELMPTFAGTNPANCRWTFTLYFEAN